MRIIFGIWIVVWLLWVVAALRAKTTVRRQAAPARLLHIGIMVFAFVLLLQPGMSIGFLADRFVPDSRETILAGIVLTAAGAALAIWARLTLGANWSGTVTVKQNHELIRRGPYRVVRHPIYTGLLLAYLGTAVAIGELRGLIGVAIATAALWQKSRAEETFMTEQFPDQYPRYRREVKALIPFVL